MLLPLPPQRLASHRLSAPSIAVIPATAMILTLEKAFLNSYLSIIQEIPDKHFEHAAISPAMLLAYRCSEENIGGRDVVEEVRE